MKKLLCLITVFALFAFAGCTEKTEKKDPYLNKQCLVCGRQVECATKGTNGFRIYLSDCYTLIPNVNYEEDDFLLTFYYCKSCLDSIPSVDFSDI